MRPPATGSAPARCCSKWGIQHLPIDQEVPRPYVSLVTVAIALGVIFLTGILAGLMPAVRASRVTPVEALRHE